MTSDRESSGTPAARLMIAGVASGVGKTTLMAGLSHALRRRGLRVQTYKCGPDYLDPTYHALASGAPCQNLDGYMMGRAAVERTVARCAPGVDLHLVEGMMGLFDGVGPSSSEGSSAEIARWLELPVVLVCDAGAMARSIGALVHGFATFESGLNLAGVVCNGVASQGHRALLQAACAVPIMGTLARETSHGFPERHLGLHHAGELDQSWLAAWADRVEAQCDVEGLLALARSAPALPAPDLPARTAPRLCRIGVARDEAFCFYYEENLRLLEEHGAELVFFSPLHDQNLPALDGIYLGGGYPELHAARLAQNAEMKAAIRAHAAAGRPLYAECGGLMYLSEAIINLDSERHEMLGIIEGTTELQRTLQAIGYVEVETHEPSILGPAGLRVRGHQFRYSRLLGAAHGQRYLLRAASSGSTLGFEGFGSGSVLASYVHLCFASAPDSARNLVAACAAARR